MFFPIYCRCNTRAYTHIVQTVSTYVDELWTELQDESIYSLHYFECRLVVLIVASGGPPWMLCLTGTGAVKCVTSTLHKAGTRPVSPSRDRDRGWNMEGPVPTVNLSCQSILALAMSVEWRSKYKVEFLSGVWWRVTTSWKTHLLLTYEALTCVLSEHISACPCVLILSISYIEM